jgi:hypothetical protein
MQKVYRRPASRRATLDRHDMVGLWTTALWVAEAAVLLATFSVR